MPLKFGLKSRLFSRSCVDLSSTRGRNGESEIILAVGFRGSQLALGQVTANGSGVRRQRSRRHSHSSKANNLVSSNGSHTSSPTSGGILSRNNSRGKSDGGDWAGTIHEGNRRVDWVEVIQGANRKVDWVGVIQEANRKEDSALEENLVANLAGATRRERQRVKWTAKLILDWIAATRMVRLIAWALGWSEGTRMAPVMHSLYRARTTREVNPTSFTGRERCVCVFNMEFVGIILCTHTHCTQLDMHNVIRMYIHHLLYDFWGWMTAPYCF